MVICSINCTLDSIFKYRGVLSLLVIGTRLSELHTSLYMTTRDNNYVCMLLVLISRYNYTTVDQKIFIAKIFS